MSRLQEIRVGIQPIERFEEILGSQRMEKAMAEAAAMRDRLSNRVVWNVNSTAVGGGVAEMLPPLLGYTRCVGIDVRWVVIQGNPAFFRITKRIHHALHGSPGDGSRLGSEARRIYEDTLRSNAHELGSVVRAGDVVILHDPQTAGLSRSLMNLGAKVVWRCHIGVDTPNEEVHRGWEFLKPYLEDVPFYVFTRPTYVPDVCDHGKSVIIQPSIDPLSPKNQVLSGDAIRTILVHTGLVEGPPPTPPDHGFLRDDGTPGRVQRRADITRLGRAPKWETPLVVQVSRWDPLKDMGGVMKGFALLCERNCPVRAELVLAGPNVRGVTDDPEGVQVWDSILSEWRALPHDLRDRIHLASLPTADIGENAAIVNALQRHATVVVQKSLQEGFGLTVAEAMWKSRPVIASAVGGIQDQIQDGKSGILLKDPTDLDAFADALCDLLCAPERREALGIAARERVKECFLGLGHLQKYAQLIRRLDDE
jgi:trehalose synthase